MKLRKIFIWILSLILILQSSIIYAQSDPDGLSFTGNWDTHFSWSTGSGSTELTCTQDGDSVHCDYEYDAGYLDGTLQDDGRTLEGTWKESETEGVSGGFVFVLAEDGNSFTGEWWNDGNIGGGSWSGTRIGGGSGGITPTITETVVSEMTETPALGAPIILKASLEGKGESIQTLPNNDNYGVIIIDGVVTDQEGKGVGGADVEVVSGADPDSITTNADGSYSIVVSVPGGLGNGLYGGVNFTLQLGDLSIHEIVLLQAIEGGKMVEGRDVGVRVYLVWTGASPVEVEVVATVDGKTQPPVRGLVKLAYTQRDNNLGKNSINLVLPHDLFPFDSVSTHSIYVIARLVDESTQESNLENNTSVPESFTLQRTKSPSLLYVSMDPSIGRAELVRFSGQANSFLEKVYPIPFAWSMVGTARVSHYVVSPNTKFLQSQSVDNLPNWVPEWIQSASDFPLNALKTGTYISSIRSVEKARIRYNAQRCRDSNGKFILPCNEPIAWQAVGVFPEKAYGADKPGFAYQSFRKNWPAMLNDILVPQNVSHELGHLYGLDDEYGSGSTGRPVYGSSWNGSLFRTETGGSINFMGQVHLGSPWVDSQTWNTLLGILKVTDVPGTQKTATLNAWTPRLDERLVTEIEEPALIVEGVVGQDGIAALECVTPIFRYEPPAENQGAFTLKALDEQQNVLAETQFDGIFSDQYDDISPIVPFLAVLPVPDPAQITLVTISQAGGPILASIERSPSIPTANFDTIPAIDKGQVTISWQANDADGDVLLSTLFYTANEGLTWQVLGTDLPVNNLTVDSRELPGGEGRFLLIVNDGMNEVEVVSAPIVVSNRTPMVVILDTYGTTFESGELVTLQGFSDDIEDGSLPDEKFIWSDEHDKIVAYGNNMQVELPVGQHKITLNVTDSDGQVGSASIDITVLAGIADSEGDKGKSAPVFNLTANSLYLLGGGACLIFLVGIILAGVLVFTRRKSRLESTMAPARDQYQRVQDSQGRWWFQDPNAGTWSIWNGTAWQPAPGTAPNIVANRPEFAPPPYAHRGKSGPRSCLFTIVVLVILGLLIVGSISLVAFDFFPGTDIQTGQGDLTEIMKKGGGGLLVAILGMFLLNGGFKAIITRRAVVTDEWGRRREKRGCGAILNGLGQLFFGVICLSGGLGLITLVLYQEVLPWLGF